MKINESVLKRSEHAPVNPATGLPNRPGESGREAPGASASQGRGAREAEEARRDPDDGSTSPRSAGTQPDDVERTDGLYRADEALAMFRRVVNSRIIATFLMFMLLLVLVGFRDFMLFFVLLFGGYVLLDRFLTVRRCLVLGGCAWLAVILLGDIFAVNTAGRIISIDYLFTFCGFLLALAVCGAFFIGRSMYYYGFERGQTDADFAIARHMIDRLVNHPDEWRDLDGDYLETESAISRVRERERLAAQALKDEASRKDDLVTYLAHDLKTPLASVVGYLSLLQEASDLPGEQRARFTGIALEKAHRLDTLIEEFFDITRFDFHDIVLTRGYVDLDLMLSQVVEEFYPALSEQDKSARIDVPCGLTVLIDGDKMARVFNNVMKNAIAYSYEGSTISVTAERREGGGVRVRIENSGDPIPAPKLKVIFEKFYRLDAARATNRGGAGLGLAIAKEIVTAHGGSIACASTPEHTVFTIDLPA